MRCMESGADGRDDHVALAAHAPGADIQRHAAGPELERAGGLERDPPGDTLRQHQARHRCVADGCHCGIPAHRTRRRPGDECTENHPAGQLPTPGDGQRRRFERYGQRPPFFRQSTTTPSSASPPSASGTSTRCSPCHGW